MLWTPQDYALGDITIVRVREEYHFFSEMRPRDRDLRFPGAVGTRVMGHAVSRDLFHWEELPLALFCGGEGAFDSSNIMHSDVFVHGGKWHIFYTATDKAGPGEQQSIGLATSTDGVRFTKHGNGPVLRADPRWYEQAVPREATYQEKDYNRLWFRDPIVWHDPTSGRFQMIVVARDRRQHPDVRGCLALATSTDLVHWTPQAPLYSPGRFHTIETPSLFDHRGRYYLMFMTHSGWGPPILATDPYQKAGDFYAVSEHGWEGPYQQPADEVVVATHDEFDAGGSPAGARFGAQRTIEGSNGERFLYGWLRMDPRGDDLPNPPGYTHKQLVPPPKRVRVLDDGQLRVTYYEEIEAFTEPTAIAPDRPVAVSALDAAHWRSEDQIVGKQLGARTVALLPGRHQNFIISARIQFLRGERAGFVLRADDQAATGWQIVADRRFGRIEFGILPGEKFLDARRWKPRDRVELKVVVYGPGVEVYADDQLMIYDVRYRETEARIGYLVERGEARFDRPRLLNFKV